MIIFFVILAIAVSFFYYRHTIPELSTKQKIFLAILRFAALSIIFILLFNPILYIFQTYFTKPEIIILHDISDSMEQKIGSFSKKEILIQKAKELKKILDKKNYKISEYDFANGLKGTKNFTDLGKSLSELIKTHDMSRTHRIIIASDGCLHDESLSSLINLNIPFDTFEIDKKVSHSDLEITSIKINPTAFQDDIVPIEINVHAKSYKGSAKINLLINNKKVNEQRVDFSKFNYSQIIFDQIFLENGLNNVQATIQADTLNEFYLENNSVETAIQIHKNRSKAIVISDKMNWDAKFILQAFQKQSRWDAQFFLKRYNSLISAQKKVDLNEKLIDIEFLVLINYKNIRFTNYESELIIKYVENGGGLLFLGNPVINISEILPVKDKFIANNFLSTFHLTKLSKKFQSLQFENELSNIPPVQYAYVEPKIEAQILAAFNNEENSPAIIFSQFNKGQVLYLPFLNIWKWQMRSDEGKYADFILNVASWLGNSDANRFLAKTDKIMYNTGEKVKISLTAFDEKFMLLKDLNAKIILKQDNKIIKESYLVRKDQKFTIEFDDLPSGKFAFEITDEVSQQRTKGDFVVSDSNLESHDIGFNNSLLKYIATQTGGNFFEENTSFTDYFESATPHKENIYKEIPLYKKWFLIFLFILSFCLELFWRKRWGLL